MIPDLWYVIGTSDMIRPGKMKKIRRFGADWALFRSETGEAGLVADQCPHRGASIAAGKVEKDCAVCPFHGFAFHADGSCRVLPANGRVNKPPAAMKTRSVPLREANGFLYAWYGEARETYPEVPWFDNLPAGAVTDTFTDTWACHYTRSIENQIDVVHLPFVHRTTIGRGNKTVVHGPKTLWREVPGGHDQVDLWVRNEVDVGQDPLRASEIPVPQRRPFLQFIFPNLWQNWIADKFRLVVAFVPVDEGETLMILRSYQTFFTVPVLRWPINKMLSLSSLVIERQDKPVVETQRPKPAKLQGGEVLIPGDLPIIEYRKRRLDKLQAAGRSD